MKTSDFLATKELARAVKNVLEPKPFLANE
jgi:hypothetical protein